MIFKKIILRFLYLEQKITIGTDGWEDKEVDEIIEIFGNDKKITREKLHQFDFGLTLAIVIGITFGGAILGGIGNAIGKDIWEKLKSKFSKRAEEKKHSALSFQFKNEKSSAQFNLKTENPKIIEKALDTIEDALKEINEGEKSSFYFESKTEHWVKIEKGKFIKTFTGIPYHRFYIYEALIQKKI